MAALLPNLMRNEYIASLVLFCASVVVYCRRFGQYRALRCSVLSDLCFCRYVSSTQRRELMNLHSAYQYSFTRVARPSNYRSSRAGVRYRIMVIRKKGTCRTDWLIKSSELMILSCHDASSIKGESSQNSAFNRTTLKDGREDLA